MSIAFSVLIIIFVSDFIFSRIVSLLNIRHAGCAIPEPLQDLYNADQYARQQQYFRINAGFGWLSASVSFVAMLVMLLCDGFAWLDHLIRTWTHCEMLVSLLFFGILFIANELLSLPFAIYRTFVIEARFGFNKTTPKTFIADTLKDLLLSTLISGSLLAAIIFIYEQIPEYFWLIAWSVVTAFSLFMSLFYSKLIVPLFNKQTPLEAGELRNAIEQFAQNSDFSLDNIYVIDSSKRSTKANAYFTGWGKRKRIVLYDTLIKQLTTNEIVAVLAHEIGHNKHHHTLKSIAVSLPMNLLLFMLLGLFLHNDLLAQALGCDTASFHINLIAFSLLYAPVSMLFDLIRHQQSRKYEYQADAFVKTNGYAEDLIAALKKITAQALSNVTPHPLYVFVHYSHPTLLQRITALRDNQNTK